MPDDYALPANLNEALALMGDSVVVPVVRLLAGNILEPILAAVCNAREAAGSQVGFQSPAPRRLSKWQDQETVIDEGDDPPLPLSGDEEPALDDATADIILALLEDLEERLDRFGVPVTIALLSLGRERRNWKRRSNLGWTGLTRLRAL